MTEPKFTPGPWEITRGLITVQVYIDKCSCFIGRNEEAMANAHLIAAAPELYAELARINPNNPVLAKARGE